MPLTTSSTSSGPSSQRSSCRYRLLGCSFEDIAQAAQRHDRDPGALQVLSDAVNVNLERIGRRVVSQRKDVLMQRGLRNGAARPRKQDFEHGVLLRAEREQLAVEPEGPRDAVVFE